MKCHSCDVRLRDTNVSASLDTCLSCAAEAAPTVGRRITILALVRLAEYNASKPADSTWVCGSCGARIGDVAGDLTAHAETCADLRTDIGCSL